MALAENYSEEHTKKNIRGTGELCNYKIRLYTI